MVKYKLLIVDDEDMITNLLSQYFSDCGYVTYTANNSKQAIDLLQVLPDLILLDINMPGMDGFSLCKTIREHVICPILFLTARITEQDKINGLCSGGDDYITKPFSLLELNARVEAHIRRDNRVRTAPQLLTSQGLIIDISQCVVTFNGKNITFSKKEFDIIEFLAMNANQVFDKEKIYEKVWGYDAEGDSNVIKEHVRKIRAKLNEITGREFITTVWGMGYKWEK
jgi:two-component system, OmpR family, lantibiotic biosynthesis response regulator NisR/SpaR